MIDSDDYYTIIVAHVPPMYATEWHPVTASGPFRTLSRGAFPTIGDAIAWARSHLNGTPYSIRHVVHGSFERELDES